MSDWMSGPHRAQRTVDAFPGQVEGCCSDWRDCITTGPCSVEGSSDPEPVELSEPVDVVAWLRALPVGAVLLDPRNVPWAVHAFVKHTVFLPAHPEGGFYHSHRDADMLDLAKHAPFRVLWMPDGAT